MAGSAAEGRGGASKRAVSAEEKRAAADLRTPGWFYSTSGLQVRRGPVSGRFLPSRLKRTCLRAAEKKRFMIIFSRLTFHSLINSAHV